MSGGVDSSVAALLLKEQGYEVIGISLKTWDEDPATKKQGKTCCSFRDIQDARRVCDQLELPFYALNYKDRFLEKVVTPFVEEYYQGRTPNPCMLCNQEVKFESLLSEAQTLGAAYLATGHYARIEKREDTYHLLKGCDPEKDQSYVLYRLTQDQLSKILLPIGGFTKPQIREIAAKNNLNTATKPDSQDICFVPQGDHADFINRHFPRAQNKGNFVDEKGNILGTHRGIHAYTIGQRRGIGIGLGRRLYVTEIRKDLNEVVLGEEEDLLSTGLVARQVHWVCGEESEIPCGVKIRYQKNEIPAMVQMKNNEAFIRFSEKNRAVTPGQTAVFYRGDEVLGGGIIERVINS